MIALSGQLFLIHIFCFLFFFSLIVESQVCFLSLFSSHLKYTFYNFFFHKALPETNLAHFFVALFKSFYFNGRSQEGSIVSHWAHISGTHQIYTYTWRNSSWRRLEGWFNSHYTYKDDVEMSRKDRDRVSMGIPSQCSNWQ